VTGVRGVNAALDRLPRDHVWCSGRPVPAYRAAGVVGFHLAVAAIVLNALAAGRPLSVALGVALVCGLSFFAWALVRLWVTGTENLVLLEHVWFACAATAGYLALLGEPVRPWLDLVSIGLALFLACGRVGCTLVGCCHGFPAGIGIVYMRQTHPLRGVRLFPHPVVELAGLVALAAIGQGMLASTRPGTVCLMLGAGYAVLRFATEGLRGDRPASRLPVSSGRAMALVQLAAVVAADEVVRQNGDSMGRLGWLAAGLVGAGVAAWRWRRPRPLSAEVVRAVRRVAAERSMGRHVLPDGVCAAVTDHAGGLLMTVDVDGAPAGAAERVCAAAFGRGPDVVGGDGSACICLSGADPAGAGWPLARRRSDA
jgi:hypothetical protein